MFNQFDQNTIKSKVLFLKCISLNTFGIKHLHENFQIINLSHIKHLEKRHNHIS